MASIDDRGKGTANRWRARYRTPDGVQRSQCFARKADAEQFLNAIEMSKATGTFVDPLLGRRTVSHWAARWLDGVRPTLKPTTIASYESLLDSRVLPEFGRRAVAKVRTSDIQTWVAEMSAADLSASRIRQAHVVLRQVLDVAMRDGALGRNAAIGVKLPPLARDEAAYFDPGVVDTIADAMPSDNYRRLVTLLGTLGLRWGEAAALQRRHVDLLRRRLRVEESLTEVSGRLERTSTKTHAARTVPLPPSLASDLAAHLDEVVGAGVNAPLFPAPKGGPLRHGFFYAKLWRPTLEQLGLPKVGLHVLRHSAAARLIAAGASPKAVQTVLGHRSAAFSLTVYGHLFDADLDALAEALDEVQSRFSCVTDVSRNRTVG